MDSLRCIAILLAMSSLIRISTDQRSFATPRSFSQLVTSFFGAMYQGILLYALCSLFFWYISISVFSLIVVLPLNFTKNSKRSTLSSSYTFVLTFFSLFFSEYSRSLFAFCTLFCSRLNPFISLPSSNNTQKLILPMQLSIYNIYQQINLTLK